MTQSPEQQAMSLLLIHRQRLHVLEQQAAQFGLLVPPHIQLELETVRQSIADLEAQIPGSSGTPAPQPPNDVVFLFTPAADGSYLLTVRGHDGTSHSLTFTLPWSEDRTNYILYVLRTAARSTATVRSAELHRAGIDPRAIGFQLYSAVFAQPVAEMYARAQQDGEGRVRLRIHASSPAIGRLPWELLHNGDDFLCLDRDTPVVRGVTVRPRRFETETPLRVLVIGGIPSDAAPLRLEHEQALIERNLSAAIERGDVVLQTLIGPNLERDLPSVLGSFRPHLLHVAGHGGLDGLHVEGQNGAPRQLSANTLGRLLRNVKSVQMVVLNGCDLAATSEEQQGVALTLARLGIPAVVGMQYEISDVAALAFAEGFYEALGWGWPIQEAVTWARSRMVYYAPTPDVIEWVTPALFVATNDVAVEDPHPQPVETVSNEAIYRGLLELVWDDDVISDADQQRLERKRVELGIPPERSQILENEVRLRLSAGALTAAQTAIEASQLEQARDCFRRALVLDPDNLVALQSLRRWAYWPDDLAAISVSNVERIERLWRITLPGRIFAAAWSPDGRWLALATETGLVIYDADTLEIQFKLSGTAGLSYSVSWSPDGRYLAAGDDVGIVRLWDFQAQRVLPAVCGPHAHIHALAFRPHQPTTLAVGDNEGNLTLWTISDMPPSSQTLVEGHGDSIYSLTWSADSSLLVAGTRDCSIHVHAPESQQERVLKGHGDWVRRLAWNRESSLLASSSGDQTVCLWEWPSGTTRARLRGHSGWVRGLSWSADNSLLFSGGGDGYVRVWSPESGTELRTLGSGELGLINDLAMRPDGRVLAVASFEYVLTLWGIPPLDEEL